MTLSIARYLIARARRKAERQMTARFDVELSRRLDLLVVADESLEALRRESTR